MKATEYKTWLPKFMGFYSSIIEFDEVFNSEVYEINQTRHEKGLPSIDSWELCNSENYKRYNNDVCKLYVRKVTELINSNLGLNIKINFDSLWSPKEYNFRSDEIYCTILINKTNQKKIDRLIKEGYNFLENEILKRFTSRDGFWSYHSNDINRWLNPTDDEYYLKCTYKVGAMFDMLLDYVSETSEIENDENDILNFNYRMFEHINEQCSFYEYCDYSSEQLERFVFIDGIFTESQGYANAFNEYQSSIKRELKLWNDTQCTPVPTQLSFDEWVKKYKIDINTYLCEPEYIN